jgi:mono/diheme cytochrome c family protein
MFQRKRWLLTVGLIAGAMGSAAFICIVQLPGAQAGARGVVQSRHPQTRQAKSAPLDFTRDIEPLFEKHCHRCHGSDQQKAGYRLDDKEAAFRGGESGEAAIVAGDADNSPLVQYIRGDDPDFVMPPEGERLTESEVKRVVRWVNEGAAWDK